MGIAMPAAENAGDRWSAQYMAAICAMQQGNFSLVLSAEAESDPLWTELRKLASILAQRCDESTLLQGIMHEVASGLLVDDVMDRIYDSFRSIIPYNRMALALLSEDQRTLSVYWLRSDAGEVQLKRGHTASIVNSSLQQIITTGQPRILNDLAAHLEQHPDSHATRLIVAEGMLSNFTCPLSIEGKHIGVLFFTSREKNAYQDTHQRIFMQIAEQVAIMVEKQCLAQRLRENEEERYKSIVRTALDGFWLVDAQGYLSDVNDAACELLGYTRQELLAMHISDLEMSETPEETARHIQQIIECGSDRFETRQRCKDGRIIDVEVSTNFVASNGGNFFAFLRDITARKRAEEEVRVKAMLLDNVNDSVFLVNRKGEICYVNQTACQARGYTQQEMIGMHVGVLNNPENAALLQPRMGELLLRGEAIFESVHLRKDGSALPVENNARLIESGGENFFLSVARDITDKKLAEEHAHLAYHDPLTGLPNRRRLVDRIEHALVQARRYERRVALLYIDLDHFKEINDTLGHDVGDAVLMVAAQRIARCIRQDDTLSRLGGDEFVVLLSEIAGADDAGSVGEKIIAEFALPFRHDGKNLALSGSIGISLYPENGAEAQALISRADTAMYQAKRAGKNRISMFGDIA